MIIYLASTTVGNEKNTPLKMQPIFKRLLSFYHIQTKKFENAYLFNTIKNYNENRKK